MWMPIIVEAFSAGLQSTTGRPISLCDIIVNYHSNATGSADSVKFKIPAYTQ